MGLAFVPLYIHYLGIEAYGLIGLFAVLTAWLSLLDMGMTPALSREMAKFSGGSCSALSIRDLLRTVEIIIFSIAVLVFIVVAISSSWIANNWLQTEALPVSIVIKAIVIMGFVIALRFIEGIYRSCMVGLQRQVVFNAITSVMATLRGVGAVVILAFVSPSISAFFLWQGLISMVTLLILTVSTYSSLPHCYRGGLFSLEAIRDVWQFASGMIGITFLALLLTQIDKILLSKLLSLSEYGFYTLAALVASSVNILVLPITQALFPRLTQLIAVNNHDGIVRTYHQGAQLVSVIVGSAAVVLMVFSDTLLYLWTHDKELTIKVAPLLSLMALGNLLNVLMWVPYHTQLAYGWTSLAVRINIVAVLVIVPLIIWVTPRYGSQGAALVWITLNFAYVFIGIHFMYRRILRAEKWRWYTQDILLPIVIAFITAIIIRSIFPSINSDIASAGILFLASTLTLVSSTLVSKLVRQQAYILLKSFFASKDNQVL